MTYNFGDSFDLYAAQADLGAGYWDSVTGTMNPTVAGRFAGSRALSMSSTGTLTKSSGVNDAVHHIVCSYLDGQPISGTSTWQSFQLFDGTTAQCSIWFRSDGAIILSSGSPTGAVLATYAGAVTAQNVWYAFEFEVVISSTAGSFAVRKNGNATNDFTATGLNTQVSANAYANKLVLGNGGNSVTSVDDLYWRSGAASGSWLGDIRCYTRMPASDQSVQFSRSPTTSSASAAPAGSWGGTISANSVQAIGFTCPMAGKLTSLNFTFNSAFTGHAKLALYDSSGPSGGPGALLATSTELTNAPAGPAVFPVVGGPAVTRGVVYWVAWWSDASADAGLNNGSGSYQTTMRAQAATYGPTFPASIATAGVSGSNAPGTLGMTIAGTNSGCVADTQQDGLATYVYDSNPGDADFYGLSPVASTPVSVIAATVRAFVQKSDAGTRTAAVQLKSGATTVASPATTLSTSGFQWLWRTDLVDPNTGAAWTAAAVTAAQIGPTVVA